MRGTRWLRSVIHPPTAGRPEQHVRRRSWGRHRRYWLLFGDAVARFRLPAPLVAERGPSGLRNCWPSLAARAVISTCASLRAGLRPTSLPGRPLLIPAATGAGQRVGSG